MIRHHPATPVLSDYAAGRLQAGAALVVACHLERCALCRDETRLWEGVGGVLLEEGTAEAMSSGAWQAMQACLEQPQPVSQDLTPAYLRRFAVPSALRNQPIRRRLWVTPNIWFAPIALAPGSPERSYLVYARRNTTLSMHTHRGREFTLVLHGSFSDDTGTFAAGDFATTDDVITHAPAVAGESECLCLISAEAPMRLRGGIPRAIQALTGTLY